jgi:hypothetical protein
VTIKGLHGKIEFRLQRFIQPGEGGPVTYFDLTDQFQAGYISEGLKEMAVYYSNRLSYQEVAS